MHARKPKPGDLVHRMSRFANLAACGAKERDGAIMTNLARRAICPACRAVAKSRQAEAKAALAAVLDRGGATTTKERP